MDNAAFGRQLANMTRHSMGKEDRDDGGKMTTIDNLLLSDGTEMVDSEDTIQ